MNIDLTGKPHFDKDLGQWIPTPHVEQFKNNFITSGPRAGQVGNRSKMGPTRPATADDLRVVDRWLRSRGR